MDKNLVIKKFSEKDVFYNNGLVNLKVYLNNHNIDGLTYELTDQKLILKFPEDKSEEYYNLILKGFILEKNIVFQTNNNRLYWDKDNSCFIYNKKYDIRGKSSGNDVKYLYSYISASDLKKNTEELYEQYVEFIKKHSLKENDEDVRIFKKSGKYKANNKCSIPVLMTQSEAVESYINYLVKDEMLIYDSKIHQFEDGGFCFRDMVNKKNNLISKWDALIYWCGVRVSRFYNSVYFIYLNSTDLLSLYEFKNYLEIDDDAIQIKNEKDGKIKKLPTNVNLSKQLKFDGIENINFYISNSSKEFEVKFFMYIVSRIYHIEKLYENESRERIKKRKEKLYKSLSKISFVIYTEDGNMKSSLEEYTKAYRLIMFFKKLLETDYNDSTLFKYLAELMTAISMSKNDQEKINLNIKKFCDNLLKFTELRKVYYEVSFKILKNNKKILGSGLYDFENQYLKEIKRGDFVMSLHSKSRELGNEIGFFAANLDDKDLLFKLRNVKNHRQMVTYFKDLKFTVLKKQSEAKFTKEFSNIMDEILTEMEEKPDCWEIIRDYIAIYAIDKYRVVSYAKKVSKGGK